MQRYLDLQKREREDMLEGFLGVTAKEIDQAKRFLRNKRRHVAQFDTPRLKILGPHRRRLALILAGTFASLDSRSKPRRDELHPNVPLDLGDELRPRLHCELIRDIKPVAID